MVQLLSRDAMNGEQAFGSDSLREATRVPFIHSCKRFSVRDFLDMAS